VKRTAITTESNLKETKSDGYKFAVAIIITFSSVGYNLYLYIINNPISYNWYFFLLSVVTLFLIVLGLILYLIIKGISLEMQECDLKKKLEVFSSYIYFHALYMGILCLFIIVFISLFEYALSLNNYLQICMNLILIFFLVLF
jgi:hypothetical protein